MIDRTEILAQMGRKRLTISEIARRTGLTKNAVRAFLNGGDAKVSSVTSIAAAVGLSLALVPGSHAD